MGQAVEILSYPSIHRSGAIAIAASAATRIWTYVQTEADRNGREYDLVHISSLSCFVLPQTTVLKERS